MPHGLLETEVKVGIEMKITIMTILEVGVEIEMIIDPSLGEKKNLGPDLTPRVRTNCNQVRGYRCQEYDHFMFECPNTPTDEEPDYEDADPASLQMMAQNYCPIDLEGEVDYLNL